MHERLMRLPEVARATGFSVRYIEIAWRKNAFPAPVQIGSRAIAWVGSEVDEWIRTRPRVRPGVGEKSAGAL